MQENDLSFRGRTVALGDQKTLSYSKYFTKGGEKDVFQFAREIDWVFLYGLQIRRSVAIDGELAIGKLIATLDKNSAPWTLSMTDPMGQKTS